MDLLNEYQGWSLQQIAGVQGSCREPNKMLVGRGVEKGNNQSRIMQFPMNIYIFTLLPIGWLIKHKTLIISKSTNVF